MSATDDEVYIDEVADQQLTDIEEIIRKGKDDCLTSEEIIGNIAVALVGILDKDDRYQVALRQAEGVLTEVEERFPNWRSFRSLIDCIDVTLHNLRRHPETACLSAKLSIPAEASRAVGILHTYALNFVASLPEYQRQDAIAKVDWAFGRLNTILADVFVMKEALGFYADPDNWTDTPSWDGDPDNTTPKAIPIRRSEDGHPCDCGDTARNALAAVSQIDALPYCTCPCSCDETPHDGAPCQLHDGAARKGLVSAPQITMTDIRSRVGDGMVSSEDVIAAANDLLRHHFDSAPAPEKGVAVSWHDLASFMRVHFRHDTSCEADARALLDKYSIRSALMTEGK